MQVRNSLALIQPISSPARGAPSRRERLPGTDLQVTSKVPVERVIQGEVLRNTSISQSNAELERARLLDGQARYAGIDTQTRAAVQAYVDIETFPQASRQGLDILI